ncbi:MAG TPA: recombinase family protein [Kribbellaceae bacterium]|nr:recombinase family protein [Kribbellaceae bacterium]
MSTSHLRRRALIYVRQSTLAQVRNNTESTARQYGLAEEAARLGWATTDIEVIDADLGLSGRSTEGRTGFKEIVGRVCVGEVGAIFGLEVSRLARSSADLSKLLELARLTDTLVVDADGVYDLADINDRLLLGLKGTMSEAELHILASRMDQSKRAAAARGELRLPLAAGFVRDDDGAVIIDPDQEVQAAVADLFAAFVATGSAYGVVAGFKGRRFPRRPHGDGIELSWSPLTYDRVLKVLSNPVYAGAYVFGRRRSRRSVSADGTLTTRTVTLPRADWETLLVDHHLGYITWEQFCANADRLAANRTHSGARPPREGAALCQGIIHCGGCGRPMSVHYARGEPQYDCLSSRNDQTRTRHCRSVRAATVDEPVTSSLLAALSGEQVALALAAADEVADRHTRGVRAAELAVERARYQADRAERALLACEPENRLVARTLETRWEARLAALTEADKTLADQRAAMPPLPSRAELETLTTDVSALWHAPTTSPRDRKRLLRTLIADVTLLPEPDFGKARIGIRWHTGATDELVVARRQDVTQYRRTDPVAIDLARSLANLPNHDIACRLNAAGHTTGAGRPFDNDVVASLRHYHQIPPPGLLEHGEVTVADIADRLGISHGAVIHWIARGWLVARRGLNDQWCVPFTPQIEADCRERVARSAHIHQPDTADPQGDHELTVAEVAAVLGISTNVVYYWIERHHIDARRGPGGRLFIAFGVDVEAACRARVAASVHLPRVTSVEDDER